MSIKINIGNTNSPSNLIMKQFTKVLELNGVLRQETELINPIITIETLSDISKFNYIQIPTFNRYYYITSLKVIRTNLYEIKCHCDVLNSFSSEILKNKAIVLRQENNFNLLLNDNIFKCKQNPRIYYRRFPNSMNNFNFILTVAGGYNS